ncbi:hypothetical protein GC197_03305 [bacterium]|nr:hypothetical protein [bacterium]
MKPSHYLLLLIILVLGLVSFADRTADVVNGPPQPEAQRDSLRKRIVRVLANWLIDRNMKQPPPENTPHLAQPPAIPPSELLGHDGSPIDHRQGW